MIQKTIFDHHVINDNSKGTHTTYLVVFTFLLLIWSVIFKVDIITTSKGTLVPIGSIKLVQNSHGGIINSILVSEGQKVLKGQLLLELDDTDLLKELTILEKKLESIDLKIMRFKSLLAEENFTDKVINYDEFNYKFEKAIYISELENNKAQLKLLIQSLEEAEEQKKLMQKTINKNHLELEHNLIDEKNYKTLSEQNIIPIKKYRDMKHKYESSKQDYEISHINLKLQEKKIEIIKTKIESENHAIQEKYNKSLRDLLDNKNEIEENIAKIQHNIELMKIKSPYDGYIEDIKTKTIGGVIAPYTTIMKIIPNNVELEIETYLDNRDIGFIKIGQDVAIKLDTYPYTVYGTIKGKIIKIASDAEGEKFKCIIKIDSSNKLIKKMNISSGMTCSVDIYTDKRRLIFYFVDPIKKSLNESFHER